METTETLDELIADRGMPIGDLARKAGIDPWTLLRLRQGTKRPHVSTINKVAKALRVKASRVLRAIEAGRK